MDIMDFMLAFMGYALLCTLILLLIMVMVVPIVLLGRLIWRLIFGFPAHPLPLKPVGPITNNTVLRIIK